MLIDTRRQVPAWLAPVLLRLTFIVCIILAAPCVQAASGAAGGFTTGFLASGFDGGSPAQDLESGGIGAISGGVTGGIFGAGGGLVGNLPGQVQETAAFGQSYATSAEWGDLLASRYGAENVTGPEGAALRDTVFGNILANQTALAGTNLNSLAAAEAAEQIPQGFSNAGQFQQAVSDLQDALTKSGITDASIGVRGSAVAGASFRTGPPFGPGSDIDFFVESQQLTAGLKTSSNIPGFVNPSLIHASYDPVAERAANWSEILGRKISVDGFQPGAVPPEPVIRP